MSPKDGYQRPKGQTILIRGFCIMRVKFKPSEFLSSDPPQTTTFQLDPNLCDQLIVFQAES